MPDDSGLYGTPRRKIEPMPDEPLGEAGRGCAFAVALSVFMFGLGFGAVYLALRHAPAIMGIVGFGLATTGAGWLGLMLRRPHK